MSMWTNIKYRYQITKAFRAGSIYMTIGSGENEKKIFPKIHSIRAIENSTEYVFTLPTGLNPDLLRKNYFAFEQVFGQSIKLDGESKKFVFTVHKGGLPKNLDYSYNAISDAIEGLKMPILCGKDCNGRYIVYDAITEPNALISGEPGSGKSTQLRAILTTLIKYKSPADLHLYLGDLKMSEFHLFKGVQHVKAVAIFPDELKRMLIQVYQEMLNRSRLLNSTGVMHIDQLPKEKKVPYILLAIDEIVMVIDDKDIKKMMVQICSLGRALGIYSLNSLQRPSHDILDTKIRSLLTVRMGFRTTDLSNAKIIGTPGAEKIKRETPGRFYLKRDTVEEMQAPYLTENEAKKILEHYKSSEWKNLCNGDSVGSTKAQEELTEGDLFDDVDN